MSASPKAPARGKSKREKGPSIVVGSLPTTPAPADATSPQPLRTLPPSKPKHEPISEDPIALAHTTSDCVQFAEWMDSLSSSSTTVSMESDELWSRLVNNPRQTSSYLVCLIAKLIALDLLAGQDQKASIRPVIRVLLDSGVDNPETLLSPAAAAAAAAAAATLEAEPAQRTAFRRALVGTIQFIWCYFPYHYNSFLLRKVFLAWHAVRGSPSAPGKTPFESEVIDRLVKPKDYDWAHKWTLDYVALCIRTCTAYSAKTLISTSAGSGIAGSNVAASTSASSASSSSATNSAANALGGSTPSGTGGAGGLGSVISVPTCPPPSADLYAERLVFMSLLHGLFERQLLSADGPSALVKDILTRLRFAASARSPLDGRNVAPLLIQLLISVIRICPGMDPALLREAYHILRPMFVFPLPVATDVSYALNLVLREMSAPGSERREQTRLEYAAVLKPDQPSAEPLAYASLFVDPKCPHASTFLSTFSAKIHMDARQVNIELLCHVFLSYFGELTDMARLRVKLLSLSMDEIVAHLKAAELVILESLHDNTDEGAESIINDKLANVYEDIMLSGSSASDLDHEDNDFEILERKVLQEEHPLVGKVVVKYSDYNVAHLPVLSYSCLEMPVDLLSGLNAVFVTVGPTITAMSELTELMMPHCHLVSHLFTLFCEPRPAKEPVRIVVAGGDAALNTMIRALVIIMFAQPAVYNALNIRLYVVPLSESEQPGDQTHFANFLAHLDGWYAIRVLRSVYGALQLRSHSRGTHLSRWTDNEPAFVLRQSVDDYVRNASHTLNAWVYQITMVVIDDQQEKTITLPFLQRVIVNRKTGCELTLGYTTSSITGHAYPPTTHSVKAYSSLTISAVAQAGESGSLAHPSILGLQLRASVFDAKKKDKKRDEALQATVLKVGVKARTPLPVEVDGQAIANVFSFNICVLLGPLDLVNGKKKAGKPVQVKFMTFMPCSSEDGDRGVMPN